MAGNKSKICGRLPRPGARTAERSACDWPWLPCPVAMFQGTRGTSCSMKAARLAKLSVQPVRPRCQLSRGTWHGSRRCSTRAEQEQFTITTPLYYANAGTLRVISTNPFDVLFLMTGSSVVVSSRPGQQFLFLPFCMDHHKRRTNLKARKTKTPIVPSLFDMCSCTLSLHVFAHTSLHPSF